MSERNNVLILLAVIVAIGFFAQAMQIFQGTDTTTVTVSLNNTGNLDTPVQSITYISQSRADIKSMLDSHIVSGYSDPRYLHNGDYYASRSSTSIDPTTATLTDYQTNLVLNHSDFPGLSSDFSDFRFAAADGTNIPHWEEVVVSATSADTWQKIPSTSTTAPTYIFGYYGNPNVSSASSGSNTFIQYQGSTSIDFKLANVQAPPFVLEIRYIMDSVEVSRYIGVSNSASLATDDSIYFAMYPGDAQRIFGSTTINEATATQNLISESHLNDAVYKAVADGTDIKYYANNVLKDTITTNVADESMGLFYDEVSPAGSSWQWGFIRKYTPTEPTWSSTGWVVESTTATITPASIISNSTDITTAIYGSYPIIPATTEQDLSLNGTQNFNYTIDFTPTDLAVTTSSSVLYADRAHTFNAVVKDHNTGIAMPTQPDKVKYRLVGSGNTSVSSKEFVGTSITLPALQKGTYTLFTSVGWNNIPTWSNEISQSVILTDAATPAQAVALSVVEALTETTTDTTSNETTEDILVGAPGRIVDGWKTMFDTIVTVIKNIIHNVSAVFS